MLPLDELKRKEQLQKHQENRKRLLCEIQASNYYGIIALEEDDHAQKLEADRLANQDRTKPVFKYG